MLTFKAYTTALDEGKVANFAGEEQATTAGGSYAGWCSRILCWR